MKYLKKTIHGLAWTTVLRTAVRGITFLRIAVLAKIIGLSIEQFGTFGVVTIMLGMLEIFTETGINVFLLQEKENWEKLINTAWIISIVRGLGIGIVMLSLANFAANYFSTPQAFTLIILASLIPIIRGFINPACIRLLKELEFTKEFIYRFSIILIEFVVTVVATIITKSATGLVLGLIISAIFEVIISFIFIQPWPKFIFDKHLAKEILLRGKWITSFGFFEYILTTIDNIVVGRLLGPASLGIYQNAYKISTVPLTEINDIVYKTSFPIFVHMGDQSVYKRRLAALKTAITTIVSMIPISFLIFIFAKPIVNILLGSAWESAIPVVKALAFLGVIRGVSSSFNSLFMAEKQQKSVTILTATQAVAISLFIVPCIQRWGIIGAAYAAVFAALCSLPISIIYIVKLMRKTTQ